MKALILSNGEFEEREIENTLQALQEIVGGYIEAPMLSEVFRANRIDVIMNSEGKFVEGLRPEIAVIKKGTRGILDIVYGNCIFVSHDDEGETIALNDRQIKIVKEELKTISMLVDKEENKGDYLVRILLV